MDTSQRRRWRNFLLDRSFQLRYAGWLSGVAALLSVALGVLLWSTSQSLIAQSRQVVDRGTEAVALGQKVAEESRKVSAVVKMNVVSDPSYRDSPELLDLFQHDDGKRDGLIADQQRALEEQAAALATQSGALADQQRTMLTALFAALGILVLGVGLAGIVVTHRVAGPVYKMAHQLDELGQGKLRIPAPLRKGDELAGFPATFARAVARLRSERERDLELVDGALAALADDASQVRDSLTKLRDRLRGALET